MTSPTWLKPSIEMFIYTLSSSAAKLECKTSVEFGPTTFSIHCMNPFWKDCTLQLQDSFCCVWYGAMTKIRLPKCLCQPMLQISANKGHVKICSFRVQKVNCNYGYGFKPINFKPMQSYQRALYFYKLVLAILLWTETVSLWHSALYPMRLWVKRSVIMLQIISYLFSSYIKTLESIY